ncbi:hypothetical protein NX773_06760 [Massilia solisilvae]|uniref:Uncharacterized protein n=1 Tax=Massilia solisilvae TaxID=1811225 RepID=A0ABT2BH64_9BURK|nr:hypothetical protein [Massilia solisilvae]MCS0607859.1 hypothetical protein [Massilia solisilvae]
MDKHDDKRQQLLVAMTASCGASTRDGTLSLLQPWSRLARHLSPLIGESGFCALFGRAARLVSARFDWVAGPSFKTIESLLGALGERLASVGAEQARAANTALLDTFTRLLADLIGEALTIRLLHSAALSTGEQNAQEQK